MRYQLADLIMMVVSFVFSIALLPTVKENAKRQRCYIPTSTSGITAVGLFINVVCGLSLRLTLGPLAWTLCGFVWLIIMGQRILYEG